MSLFAKRVGLIPVYDSMFSVDGLPNIPEKPIPGPNLELATDMGIVIGTSHHEPIGRNKREWDIVKTGPWDWTNKEVLIKVGRTVGGWAWLIKSTGRTEPSGQGARMSCTPWACEVMAMSPFRELASLLSRVSPGEGRR